MLVRILAGLIKQNNLVDVRGLELAQLIANGLRRADQAPRHCPGVGFGIGMLPFLVLIPQRHRAWRWTQAVLANTLRTVVVQRELEERNASGPAPVPGMV